MREGLPIEKCNHCKSPVDQNTKFRSEHNTKKIREILNTSHTEMSVVSFLSWFRKNILGYKI